MIKGIGVDIIEISRIRQTIETSGDRFLERTFTPREVSYCKSKQNMYQHFAARFAAKEAASKALATGWRGEFSWRDVEITNDEAGQPHMSFAGKLRERLASSSVLLSISHSDTHVVAVVLIEDTSV